MLWFKSGLQFLGSSERQDKPSLGILSGTRDLTYYMYFDSGMFFSYCVHRQCCYFDSAETVQGGHRDLLSLKIYRVSQKKGDFGLRLVLSCLEAF